MEAALAADRDRFPDEPLGALRARAWPYLGERRVDAREVARDDEHRDPFHVVPELGGEPVELHPLHEAGPLGGHASGSLVPPPRQ